MNGFVRSTGSKRSYIVRLKPFDNDWHTVTARGDAAIKNWIGDQMYGRSCTVVLVGAATANRKWIDYEIVKSWDEGLGVVGIYVHGLKNLAGELAVQGPNPFDCIGLGQTGRKLSSIVKCYDPKGLDSKAKYAWIAEHLSNAVEEAVRIRASN